MRRFALALCGILLIHAVVNSQNTIGIPVVVNYPKQVYNAGSQNWGLAQDKNGIIYVANNDGLLSFDGNFWRLFALPNATKVRSIGIGGDNRIYIGGQSEIGFFAPDKKGRLAYTSLMPLVSAKGRDFTDVWNICFFKGHVFFRAYRKILEYDGSKVIVHEAVQWNFLGATPSLLLALDNDKQLVTYKNGAWSPASKNHPFPRDVVLRAAVAIGADSTLLATQQHGLFILHKDTIMPFQTKDLKRIEPSNIYGAIPLGDDRVALNTNLSGCVIINKKGEIIQKISKKEGIQNNNVLCMLYDRNRNLWLGLDNGIDLVLYSNAIQQIFPEGDNRYAGYSSILYKKKLYLGLVSGAYEVPVSRAGDLSYQKANFTPLKGSKGQVWNFSIVNDRLFMGHLRGAFLVENDSAILLDPSTGFWNFQPVNVFESKYSMMAGTYNGINFYNYGEGKFNNPGVDAHFESARFVVQHQNTIWASHPFKGLYKVHFENGHPVVKQYQDVKGILSTNHNKLFSIDGKMVLVSDKGIFEYDDSQSDFAPSAYFKKLSLATRVSYLKEDPYGNVWFISDKKVGIVEKSSGGAKIVFLPELTNKIQANGFEDINIIDSNNVIITGENGFYHLNYAEYKKNHDRLQAHVVQVSLINNKDSSIFGGYAPLTDAPSIGYEFNSLHFEVSSTLFGEESTLEYSYYLNGFDKHWSEWNKKAEKDYTNIPPGKYVFQVKCRNNFDNESQAASFSFSVLPPWYRSWWAYTIYVLAFLGVLYLFYKRQQQKYKKQQQLKLQEQQKNYDEEQRQVQMLHQLELAESDKTIAQLQSEKLLAEVEYKNTELASTAMNLVHKVEILTKIKGDLLHFKESAELEKGAREFQKIIKVIDGELSNAQEWEQFAVHFDSVHSNYLKQLKDYCPDLSTSELKLAAYLRLNLSTKEIAQLMNISVRGVETSRYRLRKKLGLNKEEANLIGFLSDITK